MSWLIMIFFLPGTSLLRTAVLQVPNLCRWLQVVATGKMRDGLQCLHAAQKGDAFIVNR